MLVCTSKKIPLLSRWSSNSKNMPFRLHLCDQKTKLPLLLFRQNKRSVKYNLQLNIVFDLNEFLPPICSIWKEFRTNKFHWLTLTFWPQIYPQIHIIQHMFTKQKLLAHNCTGRAAGSRSTTIKISRRPCFPDVPFDMFCTFLAGPDS